MTNARIAERPLAALTDAAPIEWRVTAGLVPYPDAVTAMERRVEEIVTGRAPELVWLLEHPPLFTSGTGTRADDLAGTTRFPLYATGRGGRVTYHGPGQRVAYAMLDLRKRGQDLRRYVAGLEEWIILTLAEFGVVGERREDRVGVWVRRPELGNGREDKIAAIGVRVKKWITLHGISLNVAPDLSHYDGVLACGIADANYRVTSLTDLGVQADMAEVDRALHRAFQSVFG